MLFLIVFSVFITPQIAYSDVYIPEHEFVDYFDSNGIYSVVGNVKNENNFAVIPSITISVQDGSEILTKSIIHVPIAPGGEIPFKMKFPELIDKSPELLPAKLTFEKTTKEVIPIQILYDKTLIQHDDGHITGRIQNTGNETIHYPKIFAVVHGYEKVLDIVQNIEFIEKIEPNEILEFSMYPDPSITDEVFYYSCFAPVDTSVVPLTAQKNGGDFDFRYDAGVWYSAAKFNEEGTTMTIRGYNSYPLETYANFEFAPISGNEKFDVQFNGESIDFFQSIDEMGYWHVAFDVAPQSQGIVTISGFEQGLPPDLPRVPLWIKTGGEWWISEEISDIEFLEGIDFLFEKGMMVSENRFDISPSKWKIPSWFKNNTEWWISEQITDDDFLNSIEYLVKHDVIVV